MLERFLVGEIFSFILIFVRVGSAVSLLPGFGETYVPRNIRLVFALFLSLFMTPLIAPLMPTFPSSPWALGILIVSETLTGLFIGGVCNIIMSVTHIAGMIFSYQAGLSSAVINDVTQNSQGSLLGNFMGLTAIIMLFASGMDGLMIRGLTDSYGIFPPGKFPPMRDFVETSARLVSETFLVAVQITMPFIIVGTLLFLGGGILSRLMPTMQIFFLITPPQLLINFFILISVYSAMMLWFMEFYRDKLTGFMAYVK